MKKSIKEFYIIDYNDGTFYKESTSLRVGSCGLDKVVIADSTPLIEDAHQFDTFGGADAALQNYLLPHLAFQSLIKKVAVTYEVV